MGSIVEPSSEWAMREGEGMDDDDAVAVVEAVGTPGQQFWMKLLDQLFQFLG